MRIKSWTLIWLSVFLVLLAVLALAPAGWAQKEDPQNKPLEEIQTPSPAAEDEEEEEALPPTAQEQEKKEAPESATKPQDSPTAVTQTPSAEPKGSAPSPETTPQEEQAATPATPAGQFHLEYAKDLYVASAPYQSGLLGLDFLKAQRDPLLKYAIAESKAFRDDYTESPLYPQAYILLGDCYLKNGEPQKAAASFLVAWARFEKKPAGPEAKARFEDTMPKLDKEDRKRLSIVQGSFKAGSDDEQSFFTILDELGKAGVSGLAPWSAEEWAHFARFHYNSERAPLALDGMAQALLRIPDPAGAIMAYKKNIYFYPYSSSAATAYFTLGDVWRNAAKQPGKAVAAYLDAISQYPHDIRAEEALWKITQVYQSDLKDYPKAVEAHQKLIDRYPEGAFAPKALWEMAALYGELNRPLDAVKTYQRLQKDFPQNSQAPAALLKAGTLAEKELKDPARAKGFYESLIREYAGTKEAEEARKRQEKLKL